jgi:putative endonuclease
MIEQAWTYILASRPKGTLYIGVTRDLARRMLEHRSGKASSFTARYNVHRLVLAEHHDELVFAIQREKQLKNWRRQWKINLIEQSNPDWKDLFQHII